MPGASFANSEHILQFSTVNIAAFEQIDAGWVWGTAVSDNNFFSVTSKSHTLLYFMKCFKLSH